MKAKIVPKTQYFTIVEDTWKDPRDWEVRAHIRAFNEEHAAEIFVAEYFKEYAKDRRTFIEIQHNSLTVGIPLPPTQQVNIYIYQIWPGKLKKRLTPIAQFLSSFAKDKDEETLVNCWFTKFTNFL